MSSASWVQLTCSEVLIIIGHDSLVQGVTWMKGLGLLDRSGDYHTRAPHIAVVAPVMLSAVP
jgi:hypothetical protein